MIGRRRSTMLVEVTFLGLVVVFTFILSYIIQNNLRRVSDTKAVVPISFEGGFENYTYQYENTANNWHDAQPGISYPSNVDRLTRVTSPVRNGNYSLRAMVKPGDNYGSSGERAEVYWMYDKEGKHIVENESSGTQFYAISVYLPLDFVSPSNSLHPKEDSAWGAFQQLHGNDIYHAPPIFSIGATDSYYVQLWSGDIGEENYNKPNIFHRTKYPLGSLQRGKWVDFVWKIKFAKTFTGELEVWKRIEGETDFTQVLSKTNIPTLQFKSSINGGAVLDAYWKTGYYTSEETFTRVIYIDSNTRGTNFNDVVAKAFPGNSVGTPTRMPSVIPTRTLTPTPITTGAFHGEYFNNKSLSGTPTVVRSDNKIDFYWGGNSSPNRSIVNNGFSVKWTKKEYFADGKYRFTLRHDDGMRVYLDGKMIYDKWKNQSAKTHTFDQNISSGNHTLKVTYYDNYGVAEARVSYQKLP